MPKQKINNRITGPTPMPEDVIKAISRDAISHRSDEFRQTVSCVRKGLMPLFGCSVPPLLFTSSGTAALESTLVNLVYREDRILALSVGYYGDLYASMARQYFNENVEYFCLSAGSGFEKELIEKIFSENTYDVVLITHSESSTGVLQNLECICKTIRHFSSALIMVDAIGSIGCASFELDSWGVDVAVGVTQKGLMSPPGLSIVALSERALKRAVDGKKSGGKVIGSISFDYARCAELLNQNMVLSTPSLQSFWGLEVALNIIKLEGMENVFERHFRLSRVVIDSVESMGLSILPCRLDSSPSVSAIRLPSDITSHEVSQILAKKYHIYTGQGMAEMSSSILRIGHMGCVNAEDIEHCMLGLSQVLEELKYNHSKGESI